MAHHVGAHAPLSAISLNELRDRVVAAMAGGRSCRDVGAVFDVAPSTAGNWYRQYRRTSSYSALPMGGARRSKLPKQADWIAERLGIDAGTDVGRGAR